MDLLIDIFGYASVILRGLLITAQSFLVGGIAFLVLLARPLAPAMGPSAAPVLAHTRRLMMIAAAALVGVCVLSTFVSTAVLVDTARISWTRALGAEFALAGFLNMAAGLAILVLLAAKRAETVPLPALVAFGLIVIGATVSTSHAAGRVDERGALAVLTAVHQLGAAIWIGGLPYFLHALKRCQDGGALRRIGRRYSLASMASVAAIGLAGLGMSLDYVGDVSAIYGTAYGVMVSTKVILFAALLLLGLGNYRVVERLRANPATPLLRLRRFAEVEIGVGLTIFFAAASLTSLPPASDLREDRVTVAEIVERNVPKWPRLSSPDRDTLAIAELERTLDVERSLAPQARTTAAYVPGAGIVPPRNANDIAWSEFNHHWAGIFVLAMGLLATLARTGKVGWARHWPLVFLGLALFLFLRSDPDAWPAGPIGFWDSMRDPEIVQHRAFVLLIIAFAFFEWRVQTGRARNQNHAHVFPLGMALGGALLLTHSHALSNVKDQLLIELTHTPLALAGITAAWTRWLELRLPASGKWTSWVWPICLSFVGVILLLYREA